MNEKVDKYFRLLHPEYDILEPGKQIELRADREFIAKHLDEIESYYEDCKDPKSGAQQEGLSESEIVKNAIVYTKVEKFYRLAYGDLTPKERFGNNGRCFILEHLDEIEAYYEACIKEGSEAQQEGLTEQQIIKKAIEKLSERISVQAIGQATINIPTTAKKVAEQVENGENTREEGEKVGDDN